jgi:hypothetical protein
VQDVLALTISILKDVALALSLLVLIAGHALVLAGLLGGYRLIITSSLISSMGILCLPPAVSSAVSGKCRRSVVAGKAPGSVR